MPDLPQLTLIMDALFLPVVGMAALLFAKLSTGSRARKAEKNFYVILVVVTLITLRTVILCEEVWLIHTLTLATMIVGALWVPGQDSLLATDGATPASY
ncbi:hypothetical protein Pla22_42780 [Rubripirellula amarantea]|uniref:Uncharacterized protein n=1 Tax=Rubripirellula amarantea TaxID=2527999 RepID=A0A5C5WDR2_9BACT|nr:hypothetical protein [Rubripirellula amarantea]TWT49086.1 hypothetical protein Pla22_42780 [Rubripirellula amarantea]